MCSYIGLGLMILSGLFGVLLILAAGLTIWAVLK